MKKGGNIFKNLQSAPIIRWQRVLRMNLKLIFANCDNDRDQMLFSKDFIVYSCTIANRHLLFYKNTVYKGMKAQNY